MQVSEAKITVALPTWNSRSIAWLVMESLCNQEPPPVPWEVVVCEERHDNMCGYSYFEPYIPRIIKSGGRVRYLSLDQKMSLPNKWRFIAENASPSSEVYLMCATDNYYQPNMLNEAWYGIKHMGADWYQSYQCHFYDIDTKKMVMYRHQFLTGIEMAMKTSLAKNIARSEKKRVIDLHVLRSVKPEIILWNESDSWVHTVCTHGRNNISGEKRKSLLNGERKPFYNTKYNLQDVVPEYIYNKLINL